MLNYGKQFLMFLFSAINIGPHEIKIVEIAVDLLEIPIGSADGHLLSEENFNSLQNGSHIEFSFFVRTKKTRKITTHFVDKRLPLR